MSTTITPEIAVMKVLGIASVAESASIRESIISDFEMAMSAVTIANGYRTDAGLNMFRCKKNLAPENLPAIVIWPGTETGQQIEYGYQFCAMQMGIEAHDLYGSINSSNVSEKLLADLIVAAMGRSVTELADGIEYVSGGTDSYPDTGDVAVGVKIVLNVKYKYLIGKPYQQ